MWPIMLGSPKTATAAFKVVDIAQKSWIRITWDNFSQSYIPELPNPDDFPELAAYPDRMGPSGSEILDEAFELDRRPGQPRKEGAEELEVTWFLSTSSKSSASATSSRSTPNTRTTGGAAACGPFASAPSPWSTRKPFSGTDSAGRPPGRIFPMKTFCG